MSGAGYALYIIVLWMPFALVSLFDTTLNEVRSVSNSPNRSLLHPHGRASEAAGHGARWTPNLARQTQLHWLYRCCPCATVPGRLSDLARIRNAAARRLDRRRRDTFQRLGTTRIAAAVTDAVLTQLSQFS